MSTPQPDWSLDQWLEHANLRDWRDFDMGLDGTLNMVQRLGLTQPAPRIVTVAGTNGKGTTCLATEQLLLAAGLRVGTALSPHVDRFNERIRVGGVEATDAEICAAFAAVEQARGDQPLTYFEYSVLATAYIFAAHNLDVAVLEIGLGGRLDAFNVFDADVAIITSIGLDHQQILGDTLELIGAEKAGILRPGQRVVLGDNMPASVLAECDRLALQPLQAGRDFTVQYAADQWHLAAADGQPIAAGLPLGACAPSNIALAFMAVQPWVQASALPGVAAGLSIRGRLEQHAIDGRTLIVDVAHNPAGIRFLIEQLAMRDLHPTHAVLGMLQGKDHAGVFALMRQYIDGPWWLISTHGERAMSAQELAAAIGPAEVTVIADGQPLMPTLLSATAPGDVILAFGSFSVVEQFNMTPAV